MKINPKKGLRQVHRMGKKHQVCKSNTANTSTLKLCNRKTSVKTLACLKRARSALENKVGISGWIIPTTIEFRAFRTIANEIQRKTNFATEVVVDMQISLHSTEERMTYLHKLNSCADYAIYTSSKPDDTMPMKAISMPNLLAIAKDVDPGISENEEANIIAKEQSTCHACSLICKLCDAAATCQAETSDAAVANALEYVNARNQRIKIVRNGVIKAQARSRGIIVRRKKAEEYAAKVNTFDLVLGQRHEFSCLMKSAVEELDSTNAASSGEIGAPNFTDVSANSNQKENLPNDLVKVYKSCVPYYPSPHSHSTSDGLDHTLPPDELRNQSRHTTLLPKRRRKHCRKRSKKNRKQNKTQKSSLLNLSHLEKLRLKQKANTTLARYFNTSKGPLFKMFVAESEVLLPPLNMELSTFEQHPSGAWNPRKHKGLNGIMGPPLRLVSAADYHTLKETVEPLQKKKLTWLRYILHTRKISEFQLFHRMDTDLSGKISLSEFRRGLYLLGIFISRVDAIALFRAIGESMSLQWSDIRIALWPSVGNHKKNPRGFKSRNTKTSPRSFSQKEQYMWHKMVETKHRKTKHICLIPKQACQRCIKNFRLYYRTQINSLGDPLCLSRTHKTLSVVDAIHKRLKNDNGRF